MKDNVPFSLPSKVFEDCIVDDWMDIDVGVSDGREYNDTYFLNKDSSWGENSWPYIGENEWVPLTR